MDNNTYSTEYKAKSPLNHHREKLEVTNCMYASKKQITASAVINKRMASIFSLVIQLGSDVQPLLKMLNKEQINTVESLNPGDRIHMTLTHM